MNQLESVSQQKTNVSVFLKAIEDYSYSPFDDEIKQWHVAQIDDAKVKTIRDKA